MSQNVFFSGFECLKNICFLAIAFDVNPISIISIHVITLVHLYLLFCSFFITKTEFGSTECVEFFLYIVYSRSITTYPIYNIK